MRKAERKRGGERWQDEVMRGVGMRRCAAWCLIWKRGKLVVKVWRGEMIKSKQEERWWNGMV